MAMNLRLTDEQTEALRTTAEREGRSMQAVAIQAIEEYTSRRAQRRDALLARLTSQNREVLDRLADA
ncbi:DNA-binding protein [Branchiibius cervicis]|uniref:DNA-binding protein n=1 Tax=Branchiibius cervicis TaxID=908252 RepID=A0ABW2AXF8_9MICO